GERHEALRSETEAARERCAARDIAVSAVEEARDRQREAREQTARLAARIRPLRKALEAVPDLPAQIAQARANGSWDLVESYDTILAAVAELDEQRTSLVNEEKRLVDEYEQTRRELLATAP